MGDRTTGRLVFKRKHLDAVMQLHKEWTGGREPEDVWDVDIDDPEGFVEFQETDVNYGRFHYLDKLAQQGILFDQRYDQGSEYGPGGYYGRITKDHDFVIYDVSDEEMGMSVDPLLEVIKSDQTTQQKYLAMAEAVLEHAKKLPPHWDEEMEERAVRYRTLRLIGAK